MRRKILHFLFWTKPEENTFPLQTRVSIIALYAAVLASLAALPYNLYSDYVNQAYTLMAFQLVFMALGLMGLVSFWALRSLTTIRVFFSAALIILATGLIINAGGVRGLGFFYFVVGYAILYYVLGLVGGIVLPLYIWGGTLIRISLGNFHPESYLNDPDFYTTYLVLLSVATILGIFAVLYQHFIIRHLYRLAYIDDVTGLPNRKRLELLVSQWMRSHRHGGASFSLLGIKLHNFAQVNSFQGALSADHVLETLGNRITSVCGVQDSPGRYTGTVFLVLTPKTDFLELEEMGSRFLERIQKPVDLDGHSVGVQASVSITRYPQDADRYETLMANIMAGFSRLAGQPGFVSFFDESIHQAEARRYTMLGELRHAVANQELHLVYQPKIHLASGGCHGAEVLLRWNSTLFGPVGPDVFIPLAEEGGLIQSITRWVIQTAFSQISRLGALTAPRGRHPGLVHAINLSPLDLSDPAFREFLGSLEFARDEEKPDTARGTLEFTATEQGSAPAPKTPEHPRPGEGTTPTPEADPVQGEGTEVASGSGATLEPGMESEAGVDGGSGVDPAMVEFEITEGILMDESATVQSNLEFIRSRGFRIAIDDFGTGYSSLSYLHRLRASNLKIDRSFIQPINESNPQSPIVDAVISMAKTLSLSTTAEGVETPFQRDYLLSRACDLAQGYLYARPMDFESYRSWLESRE